MTSLLEAICAKKHYVLDTLDTSILPRIRPTTRVIFGAICPKHPEHGGFRYSSSGCIACGQTNSNAWARKKANARKAETGGLAPRDATTELVTKITKLVEFRHRDGTVEFMERKRARAIMLNSYRF